MSAGQARTPQILSIESAEGIARAVAVLRRGEVIAFPTDTLYGVGGDALSPDAAERVLEAKRREASKGMPVLLADEAQAHALVAAWPAAAAALAARFWPGALTLVLPARAGVPAVVRSGETVAVRVPGLPTLRHVIREAGFPLIGTSANRSGEPPALTAEQAAVALGDHVTLVLDGGHTGGRPSTVVAVTEGGVDVLREGALSEGEIRAALPPG